MMELAVQPTVVFKGKAPVDIACKQKAVQGLLLTLDTKQQSIAYYIITLPLAVYCF